MVSIKDQLQSVSGDLLAVRVAVDSEWSEAMEQHNYGEFADSGLYREAMQRLTAAQSDIDRARVLLEAIS